MGNCYGLLNPVGHTDPIAQVSRQDKTRELLLDCFNAFKPVSRSYVILRYCVQIPVYFKKIGLAFAVEG